MVTLSELLHASDELAKLAPEEAPTPPTTVEALAKALYRSQHEQGQAVTMNACREAARRSLAASEEQKVTAAPQAGAPEDAKTRGLDGLSKEESDLLFNGLKLSAMGGCLFLLFGAGWLWGDAYLSAWSGFGLKITSVSILVGVISAGRLISAGRPLRILINERWPSAS